MPSQLKQLGVNAASGGVQTILMPVNKGKIQYETVILCVNAFDLILCDTYCISLILSKPRFLKSHRLVLPCVLTGVKTLLDLFCNGLFWFYTDSI